MEIDTIDGDLFLKYFSHDDFKNNELEMSGNTINKTQDTARVFFNNPIEFNSDLKKLIPEKILNVTDIYPPNICIIDFILKNNLHNDKDFSLLDYGCGIPNLIYYLRKIGVQKVFGYDNWKQIEKEYAEKYLSLVGLDNDILLNEKDVYLNNVKAISHIGYAITQNEFLKLVSSMDVKYIFSDYRFTSEPAEIGDGEGLIKFERKHINVPDKMIKNNGFYPEVIYDGLLVVYKRA